MKVVIVIMKKGMRHGITIIRTNPDAVDFNMYRLINQIHKNIAESNEEKIKDQKTKIKEQKKQQQNQRTKK